jgi:iron complex outermembrane receptor protein
MQTISMKPYLQSLRAAMRPGRLARHWQPALFAALIASASAQTATGLAEDTVKLAPVTVTATLRSEPLPTVPIAVSVVDGAHAAQANLNTLFQISSEVPSLTFRTNTSNKDTSLFIRGIGTVTTSPGVEPSVSTVIDGVVFARPGQATLDLVDIDHIEVLRGPQGTLFGKNATAGVVNIVTKAPSKELTSYVDTSYFGGGDEFRLRVGASGEISPDFARFSVSALYGTYDGNVKNVFDNSTVNGYRKAGGRMKLELTPTKAAKLTFAADYLKSNDDNVAVIVSTDRTAYPSGAVTGNPAIAAALLPVVPSATNRSINSNYKTKVDDANYGISGTAEIALGDYALTAISAWRRWDNDQYQDGDRLSAPSAGINQSHDIGNLKIEQFSQELRIASPANQPITYVAGLYYAHFSDDEIYRRDLRQIVAGSPVDNYGRAVYGTTSDNYSIFGEGTYHATEQFRILAGLRLTHDAIDFQHVRTSTSLVDLPGIRINDGGKGSDDNNGVSGRVGAQFDFTKSVTAYATYSRGYKGPAYNVFFNFRNAYDSLALDPETSDSFEVGLKTTTFKDRLAVNVAAFDTTYDNFQANFTDVVLGAPVTRLINAGSVKTRGVEIDLTARPTRELSLRAAVAATHARIDHFNLPPGLTPAQIAAANIDGKPLPFSPDWRATAGATYRLEIDKSYALEFGTDYNWQSKIQYDIAETADTVQAAYGIWNASLALIDGPGHWRVSVLVKNITDKSYAGFLTGGTGNLGRIVPRDDSRYFGININKQF